jgi:uncharacterized protein
MPERLSPPQIWRNKTDRYAADSGGTIYSHTTIQRDSAPAGFEDQAPYTVALVKRDDGRMETAQITDPDPLRPVEIGMRVQPVTRLLNANGETGVRVYGRKYRPEE